MKIRDLKNCTFQFYGKHYPIYQLIKYLEKNNFSVKELPIKEFIDFFYTKDLSKSWKLDNGRIINHYTRIKTANLRYPIIYIRDKNGKIFGIFDGWHRLIKAIIKGEKTIKTIEVTEKDVREFLKTLENKN